MPRFRVGNLVRVIENTDRSPAGLLGRTGRVAEVKDQESSSEEVLYTLRFPGSEEEIPVYESALEGLGGGDVAPLVRHDAPLQQPAQSSHPLGFAAPERALAERAPVGNSMGERGFADIIGWTFQVYKEAFLRLVVIAAIVQVAIAAAFFVFAREMFPALVNPNVEIDFGAFLILTLVTSITTLLMYGAVVHAVGQHVTRSSINVIEAYRFAARRILSMIIVAVLAALLYGVSVAIFIGIVILGAGILTLMTSSTGSFLVALLGFVLIPLGAYLGFRLLLMIIRLAIRLLFVVPVVLMENRSSIDAIGRSWELVEGHRWRVFGVYAVVVIPTFLIGLLLNETIGRVWATGPYLAAILYAPIGIISTTLLYFDLRGRYERYSLHMLASDLSGRQ